MGSTPLAASLSWIGAPVLASTHRSGHSQGGDFARWDRRGDLRTLALYGRGWFALLARRHWEKVTAEQLAESLAQMSRERP